MVALSTVSVRRRLSAGSVAVTLALTGCGGSDGASADSWCEFVTESDVVTNMFDNLGTDPAESEANLATVKKYVDRLSDEAPAEIADDAKVVADVTQMLIDAFTAADFNLLDVDLTFMDDEALEEKFTAAGDRLDEYSERECGRPFDDTDGDDTDGDDTDGDDTDGDFDLGGGTLREQLVEQIESLGLTAKEAGCIADNLDFNDPGVQSGDVGAMLGVFETCDIGLDRLTEIGG